jgi:RimJ/RimL family protein N-acetyltransferase
VTAVRGYAIRPVAGEDLDELLVLMRAYCDFYEVSPDACRIGVMNDLFGSERARGHGLAEQLIDACRSECARRGVRRVTWQTAPDNLRAQAVYDRVGATREQWIDYWLPT